MSAITLSRRAVRGLIAEWSALVKGPVKKSFKRLFAGEDGLAHVRILSGPARGTWLLLDLAIESSYWIGSYDRPSVKQIVRHCREGMTAYDCGAYIGYYTAIFASVVGPTGKVIALEPDPRNFKRVQRQIDLNGWKHVKVFQRALGAGHTTVEYFLSDVATATSHIEGCYRGPQVPSSSHNEMGRMVSLQCVNLDELIFEMGYPRPDFVKLDIEGAESIALQHCRRTAEEVRPLILIELHNPEGDQAAADFMTAYNYVARDVNLGQKNLGRDFVHDYSVHYTQFVLLLVPHERSHDFNRSSATRETQQT